MQIHKQEKTRDGDSKLPKGNRCPVFPYKLKGASSGTITDIDGNYSIEAPVNGTLVFRFVGMKNSGTTGQ